jgi:hypothetical protein
MTLGFAMFAATFMAPDEFADYITAKSEQVEKELRERWS